MDNSSSKISIAVPHKERLRDEARRRLAGLGVERRARAAESIAERCLALPEVRDGRRIFICLSFGDEVDTWALVDRLLAVGKQVFVPRAVAGTRRLHVHPYPCELRTLSFGLQQPKPSAPELPADELGTLDVALLLGLGFDRRGYRLGYGGGFFDRFLARVSVPSVALAFDAQIFDGLPAEPHDVPMGKVLTESRLLRPRGDRS